MNAFRDLENSFQKSKKTIVPNVGIGITAPASKLHVSSGGTTPTGGFIAGTQAVVQNSAAAGDIARLAIISGNTGWSTLEFGDTDDADVARIQYSHSSNLLRISTNGNEADANRLFIDSSGNLGIGVSSPGTKLQVAGVISPSADNTYTLGDVTHRFADVYSMNAANNTSDVREKKQIQDSDLGLAFITRLRPVSYVWKSGADETQHDGLIAQETERAVAESKNKPADNQKPVIVTYDKESDRYGIRYTELISPIIKAVQELYAKVMGVKAVNEAQDREIASVKAENMEKDKQIAELKARLEQQQQELDAIKSKLGL